MGSGMANRGGSPKGGTSRPGSQMLSSQDRSALGNIQAALSRPSGGMSPYPGAYGGMGGPQVSQMPPGGFSPMTGSFGAYGAMGRPQVSQRPLESYPPMQGGQGLGGYMMSRGVSPKGSARGQQPSPQGLPPGIPPEIMSRIADASRIMRNGEPEVQRSLDGSVAGPSRTRAELDLLGEQRAQAMSGLSRLEQMEMMRQQPPAPMQDAISIEEAARRQQAFRAQQSGGAGMPGRTGPTGAQMGQMLQSSLSRRARNPYDTR